MDSLLKTALDQATEFSQTLKDVNQESQRLAENYQDILQERQALREANRELMSSVLYLRGRIQELEASLRKLESSCCCDNSRSTKSYYHPGLERDDEEHRILASQLDGKDPEETGKKPPLGHGLLAGQHPGNLSWIEIKNLEKNVARHRNIIPARDRIHLKGFLRAPVTSSAPVIIKAPPEPVLDTGTRPLAPTVTKEAEADSRKLWVWNAGSSSGLSDKPIKQHLYYTEHAHCNILGEVNQPKRLIGRLFSQSEKEDPPGKEVD